MDKKSFDFEVKQGDKDDDDKFFTFRGFASTFGNTDLEGDIIERGAFKSSLRTLRQRQSRRRNDKLLPMLFNHDMGMQIGSFTKARETEEGLEVTGRVNLGIPFVRENILPLLEDGDLDSMSIGFIRDEAEPIEGSRFGRRITRATLLETSVVTIPANPDSLMKGYGDFEKMRLSSDDLQDGMTVREVEEICKQAMSGTLAKKVASFLVGQRDADDPASPREVDGKDSRDILEGLKALNANLRGE